MCCNFPTSLLSNLFWFFCVSEKYVSKLCYFLSSVSHFRQNTEPVLEQVLQMPLWPSSLNCSEYFCIFCLKCLNILCNLCLEAAFSCYVLDFFLHFKMGITIAFIHSSLISPVTCASFRLFNSFNLYFCGAYMYSCEFVLSFSIFSTCWMCIIHNANALH